MAATYYNQAQTSISGHSAPASFFLAPNKIDWTKKIRRTDAPFLTAIGRDKAPSQPAVKEEWGWSYPDAVSDQLNGAIADTTTTSVTLDNAAKVQVGSILRCESEHMKVVSVNTTTNVVEVERGYSGTTAATHVDNMTVLILPPAIAENQATPLSGWTAGEKDYNYYQQMEWSIQLSHRREIIHDQESLSLAIGSKEQAELRKKMQETIPNFLEHALLFGERAIGTTADASTMGGILTTSSFITTRNTSLSGAISYRTILENLQTVHNLVGPNIGLTAMAHPQVCIILSSLFEDLRRADVDDTSVKTYWKKIDTGWFGEITLMPNYRFVKTGVNGNVPLDQILFYRPEDIAMKPLSGDSGWSMAPLPEEGWYSRMAIRGDFTMCAKNPDTRLLLGGFSTTLSDYAGLA